MSVVEEQNVPKAESPLDGETCNHVKEESTVSLMLQVFES